MLSVGLSAQDIPDGEDLRRFSDGAGGGVLVGYLSGKQHTPGTAAQGESPPVELAELAKRLSFGDSEIPPRPFIEDGLRASAGEIEKAIGEQVETARAGRRPNWGKVGTLAVGAVQELVRGDYYRETAPNSRETIERKSRGDAISDRPLIDTGDLINSLVFVRED